MGLETLSLDFTSLRVKRIRVLLGETQGQFAERLGVNINMVSRWETGEAKPMRAPVLKALLDAEELVV